MKNDKILKISYAALFAAIVFVGTRFIQIPLPFGYFNFGDCFIILSAFMVGGPYAIAASAIGAALADATAGYAIYAPATILIKSVMVTSMTEITKIANGKSQKINILCMTAGAIVAEFIMVCGYFIYDNILYNFSGALAALPGNLIQGTMAVISGMVLIAIFERIGLLRFIKK